jgi:ABC-type transport system substrate-binding protein/DNA-binding SARP family transcriptional activator
VRIEFGILGPLEVRIGSDPVRVGGPKQRALLAILLLSANRVVPRDRLIDELLGEAPADTADRVLRVQVSRLRKTLASDAGGDARIASVAPGYRLRVEPGELDLERFESLLARARVASEEGDFKLAEHALAEAESLWRGRPLADLEFEPFARIEIERLEELRLVAAEERIDAELALGHHAMLIPELEARVAENPLRERPRSQLMLALYRSGRQVEALEVYRTARSLLSEELGLEPGPALRKLESSILRHELALEAPEPQAPTRGLATDAPPTPLPAPLCDERAVTGPPPTRKRNYRSLLVTFALGALIVSVAAALISASGGSRKLRASANSIAVIDSRHNALSGVVDAGGPPGAIAAGAGAIWETDTADDTLLQIDPAHRSVERIPVGRNPTGVAVGGGEVWVVEQLDRTVSEINPRALRQVAVFPVGTGATAVAHGYGSVWVANAVDDTISRIDPNRGTVATIPLTGQPSGIAVGDDGIWVTSVSTGQLLLIDPRSNQVAQAVEIGNGPAGVAVGGGDVWVANAPDRTVSHFDPNTGSVAKIPVGSSPVGVAYGAGGVWVANSVGGTVARIDPNTGAVRTIRVGGEPSALTITGHNVWTTVLPASASHRGGTLTVVEGPPYGSAGYSTDPAGFGGISQWQMLGLTNDGLVTYRRVGGLQGSTLDPDLATAVPAPTDGGLTYTFRVRSGIRYSTGAPVRPQDFRRAIERVFTLGGDYPRVFYTGIVGARECIPVPRYCSLRRGIKTDDASNTVTFHLTAPDPDFLYKLAFPAADAVPKGTPRHDVGRSPLPATGPYETQSISPSPEALDGHQLSFRTWTLVRNPRFREWSHDAQPNGFPDRIVLTQEVNLQHAVTNVERGGTDAMLPAPASAVGRLAVRYANQLHLEPAPSTYGFAMNTRVAPFNHASVRQALNYASDRSRVVQLAGGPLETRPTCQVLPPTLAGYEPYCPYTRNPNPGGSWSAPQLARARALVRDSGTLGSRVTLLAQRASEGDPSAAIGRYLVSVLDHLGYRASLRVVPDSFYTMADSRNHAQIGWFTWYQDYPAPSNFINLLLLCRSFKPGNPLNLNAAEYCNSHVDAQVERATALEPLAPGTASGLWTKIDRQITNDAPWLSLYNPLIPIAVSPHVGNYQYNPFWLLLLDQLWVR